MPVTGYGPASPVDFTGSNEAVGSSIEQHDPYGAGTNEFGSHHGSYSGGSPSYSNLAGAAYKVGSGQSYSSNNYNGGGSSNNNYRGNGNVGGSRLAGAGGGKGGTSSSYINIVHGPASGVKVARPSYSAYSALPPSRPSAGSSYSASNFGSSPNSNGASYYSDGGSKLTNAYSGADVGNNVVFGGNGGSGHSYAALTDSSFGKGGSGGYGSLPSYSSGEIGAPSSAYSSNGGGGGGSEGFVDDLASYTSGGPTYAAVGSPYTRAALSSSSGYNGDGPSSGGAYSTTNFAGQAQYSGRIGHDYTPTRFKNGPSSISPSSLSSSKGYARFGGSGINNGGSYSAATATSSAENAGFNGRSLKGTYNNAFPVGQASGESDFLGGQFSDGAGVKVQSSYSAY